MDHSCSDSSTDDECVFGNTLVNIYLPSTSKGKRAQCYVSKLVVESEDSDESGVEDKENQWNDENRNDSQKDRKEKSDDGDNDPGAEDKENQQNKEESDDEEGWLCASGPDRTFTQEEMKKRDLLKAESERRSKMDFEDRIDDEKSFSSVDDQHLITYLVKHRKYSIAHHESTWSLLSATDTLMPRRSPKALRKRFFHLVRRGEYNFYTCDRQALTAFKSYRKRLIHKFLNAA